MQSPYRDAPGYTQLERALAFGGFYSARQQLGGGSMEAPNMGVSSWKQAMLAKNQYQFSSPGEAALAIKSAARLYGALRCGITKRDKRWDYDPMYSVGLERELIWEKDFPFEPKTVIVILVEMEDDRAVRATHCRVPPRPLGVPCEVCCIQLHIGHVCHSLPSLAALAASCR